MDLDAATMEATVGGVSDEGLQFEDTIWDEEVDAGDEADALHALPSTEESVITISLLALD